MTRPLTPSTSNDNNNDSNMLKVYKLARCSDEL
jgi:hypothetical protein